MSKKDKKDLINFLQKREKVILNFSSSVSLEKSKPVKRDGVNIDNNGFEMILKISTDTLSPEQKGWFNETWNEQIARDCFDEAITTKSELFCFLDHNIDIKNTLASTRNNSMLFEKSETETAYFAKVKLDETNEMHKDLITKIRSGLVNSNSFIFIPRDVEYIEHDSGEIDVTVIHKRGELISIDPVILPFYPTNEIQFSENKGKDGTNMELENKEVVLKSEDESEKETPEDKEKDEKETPEDDDEKETEKPEDKEEPKEPEKKQLNNFKIVKKGTKVEIEYEGLSDAEIDEKINQLLDAKKTEADNNEEDDTAKAETSPPDKSMDGEEIESETDKKRSNQIIKNNGVIKKMNDILKSEKPNTSLTAKDLKDAMLKKSLNTWGKPLNEEIANSFITRVDGIVKNEGLDESLFLQSINNCSAALNLKSKDELKSMLMTRTGIDGSNYTNGLAYISIINDPEVKAELERTLPEIAGADFIQLDNLDIVQKDLLIPSSAIVSSVVEGAASTAFNGKTVSIQFKPIRYALEHQANTKLPNFSQIMEKETEGGKNGIVTALRTAFYTNLVQHKGVTFATLVTDTGSTYLGGITKDALLATAEPTKLQISDFDNLINTLESKYGTDEVKSKFVFLMHPKTRSFLFTNLRTQYNAVWVANASQNSFRDIPIVTAPMFPGSVDANTGVATTGTLAFILCRKDTIAVRGFNFVIEDNPFISMTNGLATRYQNTRGEMKLYDPFINTYAVQVGTVTQYTIEKIQTMSAQEVLDIHQDADLFKSQDKAVKKEIETIVRDVEKNTK